MPLLTNKCIRQDIIYLKNEQPSEFGRYIMALKNLEDSDDWSRICGIHGNIFNPNDSHVLCPTDPKIVRTIGNTPDEDFYCAHGVSKFISWHLPYVLQYELLLNKYNTSKNKDYLCLPYLDLGNFDNDYTFINEPLITILFDDEYITINNPLATASYYDAEGIKKPIKRNGFLTPTNDEERLQLNTVNKQLHNTLYALKYETFSSNVVSPDKLNKVYDYVPLETPHNQIHNIIGGKGGNMGDVTIAAYDPLFWMHHCNMDRFFYNWLYNNTDEFDNKLNNKQILPETLDDTLSPFFDSEIFKEDFINSNSNSESNYGWKNNTFKFLVLKNILNVKKYPYTYNKIYKKISIINNKILNTPFENNKFVELVDIPIPMETVDIYFYLFPKNVTINDDNKKKYIAGIGNWFGINRHLKHCIRCERSRTNIKIDIHDYITNNNITDLNNHSWFIEAHGKLHNKKDDDDNDDNKNDQFLKYTHDDILKDGELKIINL